MRILDLTSAVARRPTLFRQVLRVWPCIRGTGVRIERIEADWSEVHVRLPLSLRTRNYVGTIFGGSMFAALDPWPMIALMNRLGPEYVVWDKAGAIRFRRPGRSTLRAVVRVGDVELDEIRDLVADPSGDGTTHRTFAIDLTDEAGDTVATVEKTVFVATKAAWRARQEARALRA